MIKRTRRDLLKVPNDAGLDEPVTIASLIIQTKPERLEDVSHYLSSISGCEIHGRDPCGKLIVVMESVSDGALGGTMTEIGNIAGVLGVNLVFHHSDQGGEQDSGQAA